MSDVVCKTLCVGCCLSDVVVRDVVVRDVVVRDVV